jgi:hypothetical protein
MNYIDEYVCIIAQEHVKLNLNSTSTLAQSI